MNTVHRLIDTFIPSHYDLKLELLRTEREFRGTVTIYGVAPKSTDILFLHGKDITIQHASIDGDEAVTSQGEDDEISLSLPEIIKSGEHTITLTFEGKITDPMHGLYPCYYKVEGEKKELLATQFESHHAREVFPCIDEPEAKATFDLTLTTEADVAVLGNMPVKEQLRQDKTLKTTFETSPRMSTYLLAFVVGDLQQKAGTTKGGVEVGIWATKAQPAESLDFALETSIKAIEFFNSYFGTPYPLPKADHIALPDFSSGAMENWGLITYREACLLVDPQTTSVASREYIATVIVHELSHQWFGNLVTMKWWDDLWLNESFASLMEYIGLDALFPEWNVWLNFTTSESLPSLRRDSLPGVQAVKTEVHHPDEISTLFDPAIVYAKGARVLRMLREYIGDEAFQVGLKSYFAAHAYQNTTGDDLWAAFGKASGKDISAFMKPWLEVAGFPVVSATLNETTLHLSQQQFLIGAKADAKNLWPIPLNASQTTIPALMDTATISAPVSTTMPVKLNQSDASHFITHYDDSLRKKLGEAISSGDLPAVDRLQVLHEASLLPRAGISSSAAIIPLLQQYHSETSEPVWEMIAVTAAELRRFIEKDKIAEKGLKSLSASLAITQYERLGWNKHSEETESDTKLRATIIALMLYADQKAVRAEALERYNSVEDIADLDNELSSLILGTAVRHHPSKQMVIDRLLKLYATTASTDLQQDTRSALTSTRDTETITRLLSLMKDAETIRPQDVPHWFALLMRNRYSRALTWAWLRDNWAWIESTFGSDKSYDMFPRYVGMLLMDETQLQEFKDFFLPLKDQPALTRAIEVGISEIEGRVEWIKRDTPAVVAELRNFTQ